MTILGKGIGHAFYDLNIDIFRGKKLDGLFEYFILYYAPMLIINYLFIFRNKKYEYLIDKYKYYNGKRFMIYFFGTLLVLFLLALLVMK